MYVCMCVCVYIYMHLCICMCIYIYIYICEYAICMYIYIYICNVILYMYDCRRRAGGVAAEMEHVWAAREEYDMQLHHHVLIL